MKPQKTKGLQKAFWSRIVSALPAHPLARMLPIGNQRPQMQFSLAASPVKMQ
jgi:hypothetical protein